MCWISVPNVQRIKAENNFINKNGMKIRKKTRKIISHSTIDFGLNKISNDNKPDWIKSKSKSKAH